MTTDLSRRSCGTLAGSQLVGVNESFIFEGRIEGSFGYSIPPPPHVVAYDDITRTEESLRSCSHLLYRGYCYIYGIVTFYCRKFYNYCGWKPYVSHQVSQPDPLSLYASQVAVLKVLTTVRRWSDMETEYYIRACNILCFNLCCDERLLTSLKVVI